MQWTARKVSQTCCQVDVRMERNRGWEQWALLSADRHVDNPLSDRAMQKRHLDQAKERGAFVIDVGDYICGMQGKNDKRHSKSSLLPDVASSDYLGDLIDFGANFLEPYKENIAFLSKGNHELGLKKHHELDVIHQICNRLGCVEMGFRGWCRLQFLPDKSHDKFSRQIYFIHGSGGSAPVTKGVIAANRRAVQYPTADIIVSGHIHEGWAFPIQQVELLRSGNERRREQLHLAIPTYKDEITNADGGFAAELEFSAKPIGAWWLRFFWADNSLQMEYTRAV
jgi:hypothetical protein